MTTFSDLTQYPNLYSSTYWGNFKAPLKSDKYYASDLEIIQNRNRFVRDYDIKKSLNGGDRLDYISEYIDRLLNSPTGNFFDHVEAYSRSDGMIIIITSPYMINESQHESFDPIYKMYARDAFTYIQFISKSTIMEINKREQRIAARKYSYLKFI